MTGVEACLVDVYRTVVACDFAALHRGLAEVAGVPEAQFGRAADAVSHLTGAGRLTMRQAMHTIVTNCGVDPTARLIDELVEADRMLLLAHSHLYDDVVDFLELLRHRGLRSAVVSNCAENTRPLLAHLGLDQLVDTIVLSCEVGCLKPDRQIFDLALSALGAPAASTLLIDDQIEYCLGARQLGIRVTQLARGDGQQTPGIPIARSLDELARRL